MKLIRLTGSYLPLHRGIGFEDQQHCVLVGNQRMGELRPTKPAQYLLVCGVAVVDDNVVVGALLVGLQLELGEPELDPVAGGSGEDPHALLHIS